MLLSDSGMSAGSFKTALPREHPHERPGHDDPCFMSSSRAHSRSRRRSHSSNAVLVKTYGHQQLKHRHRWLLLATPMKHCLRAERPSSVRLAAYMAWRRHQRGSSVTCGGEGVEHCVTFAACRQAGKVREPGRIAKRDTNTAMSKQQHTACK